MTNKQNWMRNTAEQQQKKKTIFIDIIIHLNCMCVWAHITVMSRWYAHISAFHMYINDLLDGFFFNPVLLVSRIEIHWLSLSSFCVCVYAIPLISYLLNLFLANFTVHMPECWSCINTQKKNLFQTQKWQWNETKHTYKHIE